MPSLGETVASLARQRSGLARGERASGRLSETEAFGVNPGNLRMLTYVPTTASPGAGLVVVLHGCSQTAESYAEGAGWLELADRYGFVVLCPEQQRSNNANLCFSWFQPEDMARDHGEPASIHNMIVTALAAHQLDSRRVFIAGLSAGGAMASVMLATYPEAFAAGAIIAGLPYGSASGVMEAFAAMSGKVRHSGAEWGRKVRAASPSRDSWPRVCIWQGDQDHTVKAEVAEELAAQWVDVHQAEPVPSAPSLGRRTVQSWRSSAGKTVVELHRISGMGHGAPLSCLGPDACGKAGAFLLDVGVSSSMEMARAWGLTGAETSIKAPATRTAGSAKDRYHRPSGTRSVDVGEVIAKALRTAGLMK